MTSFKCFKLQLEDTKALKKSTVESSYPKSPGISGFIDTGIANPKRTVANDNLRSFRYDKPVMRLLIGLS